MPELDNVAIARQLELMADLLEIQGADKFRFLSYRKAANSIRAWPEQLASLAEHGDLTDVPGVGAKLAKSIAEMLHRGTFSELEVALSRYPAGLVQVMDIPGVGPKRARQIYEKLGVDSLDALDKALDAGDIARLGGMGARSADNIRRGLTTYLAHHGRMLLGDALPLAEHLAEELRAMPLVDNAEPAGSIRRMEETVEDIVLVVASADPEAVIATVQELPAVAEVVGSDASGLGILTTSGPRVDVRIVEPGEYGSALQQLTGSAAHNAHLDAVAAGLGLELSECGVVRLDADGTRRAEERLGGATEAQLYELLGMQVPPPEIREDTGEIEAACAGELPRLLELGDIRGDFHAHTISTDSHATLEENRAMAASLGYEYIAVTDHAYDLRMVGGLSVEQLEEQWAHVDRLNEDGTGAPVILKGIELNIGAGGRVDYEPEVLRRFDFCIASLHAGWNEDPEAITARLLAAMDNPYVDIIGHPTGRIIGRREPLPLDIERVLAKAAETGTIMEINAYPDRLDLKDTNVRRAKEHGVRIALGCDAHRIEHMRYMHYGVATARRGWLRPEECLNAQPLETVRTWFKRAGM